MFIVVLIYVSVVLALLSFTSYYYGTGKKFFRTDVGVVIGLIVMWPLVIIEAPFIAVVYFTWAFFNNLGKKSLEKITKEEK